MDPTSVSRPDRGIDEAWRRIAWVARDVAALPPSHRNCFARSQAAARELRVAETCSQITATRDVQALRTRGRGNVANFLPRLAKNGPSSANIGRNWTKFTPNSPNSVPCLPKSGSAWQNRPAHATETPGSHAKQYLSCSVPATPQLPWQPVWREIRAILPGAIRRVFFGHLFVHPPAQGVCLRSCGGTPHY